jgi:hypothetical protein
MRSEKPKLDCQALSTNASDFVVNFVMGAWFHCPGCPN